MSTYTEETDRLKKLAGAASVATQEFERTLDPNAAKAAEVLFLLIDKQLEAVDAELDALVDKCGI